MNDTVTGCLALVTPFSWLQRQFQLLREMGGEENVKRSVEQLPQWSTA